LALGVDGSKWCARSISAAVEAGEEIVITRRGRPVARLVPAHADEVARRTQAFARIAALRAELAAAGMALERVAILAARDEGRP
jgi:prevent-host-death family protein